MKWNAGIYISEWFLDETCRLLPPQTQLSRRRASLCCCKRQQSLFGWCQPPPRSTKFHSDGVVAVEGQAQKKYRQNCIGRKLASTTSNEIGCSRWICSWAWRAWETERRRYKNTDYSAFARKSSRINYYRVCGTVLLLLHGEMDRSSCGEVGGRHGDASISFCISWRYLHFLIRSKNNGFLTAGWVPVVDPQKMERTPFWASTSRLLTPL
jgi:hypothetical protein